MAFSKKHLHQLVALALQNNASDIHLRENEPPALRILGELVGVNSKPLMKEDMQTIKQILTERLSIKNDGPMFDIDGSYQVEDKARLRYNIFHFDNKLGMVLRIVKKTIPGLAELHVAESLKDIFNFKNGLVLVTGPTGSGKSTTLASLINEMNKVFPYHIVTLEDPIEYLYTSGKSKVTQREVGVDIGDFASGLKSSLRQDPDIILIGEMRDKETISAALKASETGHLVLSTLHTNNVLSTIGRILSMFDAHELGEVKKRLADNLRMVASQKLLKGREKKYVLAQEILFNGPGSRECILGKEPLERITQIMAESKNANSHKGQTFEQTLMELLDAGKITKQVALANADSSINLVNKLMLDDA